MELTLLGVTFSVADWIDMKSYDSTCGLASRAMKPSSDDAVIVKALRDHLLATPLLDPVLIKRPVLQISDLLQMNAIMQFGSEA
jgi:hypothetical protein